MMQNDIVSVTGSILQRVRRFSGRWREREGVVMSAIRKAAIIAVGTVATGLYLAVPTGADPGFDPCRGTAVFVCGLVPSMPDLDNDVDLTQDPGALNNGQSPGNQPGGGLGGG